MSILKKQTDSEIVIERGRRLAETIMTKVQRDNYTVFETACAAQVMLGHCQNSMRSVDAESWNHYVRDLAEQLTIQPKASA